MIISMDFFGYEDGSVFDTKIAHTEYNSLSLYKGLIDHIYVDEDLNSSDSTNKNEQFYFTTIMIASLNKTLEAGSIFNNGVEIDKVRFQKRKSDELYWTDVAELEYSFPAKTLYEAVDKYVQNDFEYEYSLLPVTDVVTGVRVKSNPITVEYDGYFISDKENNYRLLLNSSMGAIEHISPSTLFEPLGSRYPVISYGTLDYRQSSISATIISSSSLNKGDISIKNEKMERDKLMRFIKNKKPKIFRGQNAEMLLIAVIDNPREEPNNKVAGISSISFSFAEIGEINSETLRRNDLIEGLSEV